MLTTTPAPLILISHAYAEGESIGFISMRLIDNARQLEFIEFHEEVDDSPQDLSINQIVRSKYTITDEILKEAQELTKVKFRRRSNFNDPVTTLFEVDAPDEKAYKELVFFLKVIRNHFKKLNIEQAADLLISPNLRKVLRNIYIKHYLNKKKRKN